jgi:hypothetical protein
MSVNSANNDNFDGVPKRFDHTFSAYGQNQREHEESFEATPLPHARRGQMSRISQGGIGAQLVKLNEEFLEESDYSNDGTP